jgi:hypothetical protein
MIGQQALVAVGLMGWLAACAKGPTAPRLDESFRLQPGETATVRPEGLQVTFESVASDSRCPVDVTCVWEGDAVVTVTVMQPPRARETLELHTTGTAQAVSYGDFQLQLQELQPQPRSSAPVAPADYRLRLIVRRTP